MSSARRPASITLAARSSRPGKSAAKWPISGSAAYAYGTAAGRALLHSDERWRELSVSTDRDDATAADRDPLGVSDFAT